MKIKITDKQIREAGATIKWLSIMSGIPYQTLYSKIRHPNRLTLPEYKKLTALLIVSSEQCNEIAQTIIRKHQHEQVY